MSKLFNLKNKYIIITKTNKKLEKDIIISLAKLGANIIGINLNNDLIIKNIIKKYNIKYFNIKIDLINLKSIKYIINEIILLTNHIDILINNILINEKKYALNFNELDWENNINNISKISFFFIIEISKIFLKQCSKGKIINIISNLNFNINNNNITYLIIKNIYIGITKGLSYQLSKLKININTIIPGYIIENNIKLRNNPINEQIIINKIPNMYLGKNKYLIGSIIFFITKASDYINGHILFVDGGYFDFNNLN